jgi:hypothetical protein
MLLLLLLLLLLEIDGWRPRWQWWYRLLLLLPGPLGSCWWRFRRKRRQVLLALLLCYALLLGVLLQKVRDYAGCMCTGGRLQQRARLTSVVYPAGAQPSGTKTKSSVLCSSSGIEHAHQLHLSITTS